MIHFGVSAMNVLVLNAGSSTLKFKLLALRSHVDQDPQVVVSGLLDKLGTAHAGLELRVAEKGTTRHSVAAASVANAAEHAIQACLPHGIQAMGHRVVH